jgi:hypothetical protein
MFFKGASARPYMETIITMLQEIKVTQGIHSNMLNGLLQNKNIAGLMPLPRGIIPLKTVAELETLNKRLRADESVFNALVRIKLI